MDCSAFSGSSNREKWPVPAPTSNIDLKGRLISFPRNNLSLNVKWKIPHSLPEIALSSYPQPRHVDSRQRDFFCLHPDTQPDLSEGVLLHDRTLGRGQQYRGLRSMSCLTGMHTHAHIEELLWLERAGGSSSCSCTFHRFTCKRKRSGYESKVTVPEASDHVVWVYLRSRDCW